MLCTDYDKIVLCCWYFVSWLFLAMVPAVLIKEVQRCWDEGEGGGRGWENKVGPRVAPSLSVQDQLVGRICPFQPDSLCIAIYTYKPACNQCNCNGELGMIILK